MRQRKTSEPATRSYTHLTRQSLGPASISHEKYVTVKNIFINNSFLAWKRLLQVLLIR